MRCPGGSVATLRVGGVSVNENERPADEVLLMFIPVVGKWTATTPE